MMSPDTKPTAMFARHKTFHPHIGCLKKGYDKVQTDSQIVMRDDAPIA